MLHIPVILALLAGAAHDGVHGRLAAIETRIAEHPLDASLRVAQAGLLREHGEFARALDVLETASRLDECAPRLEYERAECLLGLGRDAEAECALTRVLEQAPGDALAHRTRARSRERQGRFVAALEDRETVARLALHAEPEIFLELAEAHAAVGEIGKALETLDRGVERLGMAPALVLRAIELAELRNDVDGALSRLETWARTLPRKTSAFVLRGEILERAQRAEGARRAWSQALSEIGRYSAPQRYSPATRELAARARSGLARLACRGTVTATTAAGIP